MQQLFDGRRLLSLVQEWLVAPSGPSSYLQATGALLIANMARNGEGYNTLVQDNSAPCTYVDKMRKYITFSLSA